ncbi:hypothetical protein V2G26_007902 [Clonostachys chloroleuca]
MPYKLTTRQVPCSGGKYCCHLWGRCTHTLQNTISHAQLDTQPRDLTVNFSFSTRKHTQPKLIRVHSTHIDTFVDTYVNAFIQHFNNTCIEQYPKFRQRCFSVIDYSRIYISSSYLDYIDYRFSSTSSTSSAPASTSTTPAEVYTGGFATFYFQNGSPPACGGRPRSDSELIVALDMRRYGSDYSAPSPYCSKMIRVTNANNGRSVDVTVVDVCPTCLNSNSLDLSPTAFQAIGDLNDGMVPIVWQFV